AEATRSRGVHHSRRWQQRSEWPKLKYARRENELAPGRLSSKNANVQRYDSSHIMGTFVGQGKRRFVSVCTIGRRNSWFAIFAASPPQTKIRLHATIPDVPPWRLRRSSESTALRSTRTVQMTKATRKTDPFGARDTFE